MDRRRARGDDVGLGRIWEMGGVDTLVYVFEGDGEIEGLGG